jgi:vacuolar-type H+-ATPase subunit I/STV1
MLKDLLVSLFCGLLAVSLLLLFVVWDVSLGDPQPILAVVIWSIVIFVIVAGITYRAVSLRHRKYPPRP